MPNVFVYGALMTHPFALHAGFGASVEDHAVRFLTHGLPFIEPSFAVLVEAPGETAYGVVVPFDERTWRRERAAETPYRTHVVRATSFTGESIDVIALMSGFRTRRTEATPSARYASLLHAGAVHHGLPTHVVERYASLRASGPAATLHFARMIGDDGDARLARHRKKPNRP